jgi:hypothetical protein
MTIEQRLITENKLIKQIETRRVLNLNNMTLGEKSVDIIRNLILKGLVAKVSLSESGIGDAGLLGLLQGDLIKDSRSLVTLDLSCNGLTGKSIRKLCEAIVYNRSLLHINLSSY